MDKKEIKLSKELKLAILKEGIKKGTTEALNDPVDWAIALTSGAVTGIKEKDRDKGLLVVALLMSKGIIVKSVESYVEICEQAVNELKEEK